MSNGGPPPVSGSSYIIICNGRIGVAAGKGLEAKICAASNCAAQLCSFIESSYEGVDKADFGPVSELQHYLMDNLKTIRPKECDEKIAGLFDLLDALEDKYSEHNY